MLVTKLLLVIPEVKSTSIYKFNLHPIRYKYYSIANYYTLNGIIITYFIIFTPNKVYYEFTAVC